MYKIIMWGTTNQGEGHVMRFGEYTSADEIRIYTAMLGPDILITFSEEEDDGEEESTITPIEKEEPIRQPERKGNMFGQAGVTLRGQNGVDW